KHFPQAHLPFTQPFAQYVLLEISDSESAEHAQTTLEQLVEQALEQELILDALLATSIAQPKALWALREHIPLAQAQEGKNIKHDISVPVSRIAAFIRDADALLQQQFPGCRMVTVGHVGDGNLHYSVSPPENTSGE